MEETTTQQKNQNENEEIKEMGDQAGQESVRPGEIPP